MTVGGGAYYLLGNKVPENIVDSIEGKLVGVAEISLVIHFFFAYVITVNPSMQGMEQLIGAKNGMARLESVKRVNFSTLMLKLIFT